MTTEQSLLSEAAPHISRKIEEIRHQLRINIEIIKRDYPDKSPAILPHEIEIITGHVTDRLAELEALLLAEVRRSRTGGGESAAFEIAQEEAQAIVVIAISRLRAAHIACLDLTLRAEEFLRMTNMALSPLPKDGGAGGVGKAFEIAQEEAQDIVVTAIRRLRAAHVSCLDLVTRAEAFLRMTNDALASPPSLIAAGEPTRTLAVTAQMVAAFEREYYADKGGGPDGRTNRQSIADGLRAALSIQQVAE